MKKGLKMVYASGTSNPAIPQAFSELDNFKPLQAYMCKWGISYERFI
jgi:hypothetical protein